MLQCGTPVHSSLIQVPKNRADCNNSNDAVAVLYVVWVNGTAFAYQGQSGSIPYEDGTQPVLRGKTKSETLLQTEIEKERNCQKQELLHNHAKRSMPIVAATLPCRPRRIREKYQSPKR